MKQYLDLMRLVRETGRFKADRTGTGTYSVFGHQMRFDLSGGQFPLVTTKKCHLKSIIHELLWFLQGDTNIKYLNENGVRIWDEWADENGDLGPVYGYQWRSWPNPMICNLTENMTVWERAMEANKFGDYYAKLGAIYANYRGSERHEKLSDFSKELDDLGVPKERRVTKGAEGSIDQIINLIEMLKKNPDNRRLIVSAWNPALVDQMALPPCHALFQFYSCELTRTERLSIFWSDDKYKEQTLRTYGDPAEYGFDDIEDSTLDEYGVPTRKLSCQLYQRKLHCALVA